MQINNSITKTVIDIGNSKIKIITGELYDGGTKIRVQGYVTVPTRGMKKSVIENPEELTESILEAISELEKITEIKIKKVIAGISSPHIKSKTINKKIRFEKKEITEQEMVNLVEVAKEELQNEVFLYREIYNIRVNNSGITKNPVGIVGSELRADIHMICLDETIYAEYEEVLERAGLEVEELRLACCGAAESVLDDSEKEEGVALIDIGEGITDILMFKNKKLIYSKTIPLGGMHYTNDVSYILEITKEEANQILNELRLHNNQNHIIRVGEKEYTVQYIKSILDARTEDIVKFIRKTVEDSGFNGYLGKGIVITGGALILDELIKKITRATQYKVNKKLPFAIKGLEKVDPSMSCVIGLLTSSLRKSFEEKEFNSIQNQIDNNFEENILEEEVVIEDVFADETSDKESKKLQKLKEKELEAEEKQRLKEEKIRAKEEEKIVKENAKAEEKRLKEEEKARKAEEKRLLKEQEGPSAGKQLLDKFQDWLSNYI